MNLSILSEVKVNVVLRGQIIDIFSPLENKPARILYNFEEVETVNYFDIYSQNNCGKIKNYLICLHLK